MKAVTKRINLRGCKRIICVSDIHGELDAFKALLSKVEFGREGDALVLVGDLFLKGSQPQATLEYIMELSQAPNVHITRGNCDFPGDEWHTAAHVAWLEALPDIIEAEDYIFVHGALVGRDLEAQEQKLVLKNDAFIEQGLCFDKYIITGHWPVNNYCHGITSQAPIVNEKQKIIAIDGGMVVQRMGQLNAFIIEDGAFSHQSVDKLESFTVPRAQAGSGGFSVTWNDRFIEIIEDGPELALCRHLETGNQLYVAKRDIWQDAGGNLCCVGGTDYFLPVEAGDSVKLGRRLSDRILAKKGDIVGWIML